MSESRSPSIDAANDNDAVVEKLSEQLFSNKEASQLQAITELASLAAAGVDLLIDFLCQRKSNNTATNYLDGKAYQILLKADSAKALDFLTQKFPHGLVELAPELSIDLNLLQELLAKQDFEAADRLTTKKMCEAAGSGATERGWLYFTDADRIDEANLSAIDNLWRIYSENKFGFSIQRQLWLSVGKDWSKLWQKIGWKQEGRFTRYPDGFTWDIDAPKGHLPLSNQIRGNKTLTAIFSHRLWSQ